MPSFAEGSDRKICSTPIVSESVFLTASSVLQAMGVEILNNRMLPGCTEIIDGRHFHIMGDNIIKAASGHAQATAALCLTLLKDRDMFLGVNIKHPSLALWWRIS